MLMIKDLLGWIRVCGVNVRGGEWKRDCWAVVQRLFWKADCPADGESELSRGKFVSEEARIRN
jgi:hypothetical protein